jgi:protein AbiQ
MSASPQANKRNRPFVGILILVNGKKYCIPLSSPKPKFESKKNSIDFIKITHQTDRNEKGGPKIIGALNINNMLPIEDSLLTPIDLKVNKTDSRKDAAYKDLMKAQLSFCQHNQEIILKRANKLYDIVVNHPNDNRFLVKRCCDFRKLESISEKYLAKKDT